MISQEPVIRVGIFEHYPEVQGSLQGKFAVANVIGLKGDFVVRSERGTIFFTNPSGQRILSGDEILCQPLEGGTFTLKGVKIGIDFHWERKEDQAFEGRLRLVAQDGRTVSAINEIGLESYLKSVISSEMSAQAPLEFLKAHAIIGRSWLVALLERKKADEDGKARPHKKTLRDDEVIRVYGHENHGTFDVCADDHCQRYQGVTKIINDAASQAVEATRGIYLVYKDEVCDTRYSKSCGGLSENYENVWDDQEIPYLRSVSDSLTKYKPVKSERDAEKWIHSTPDAYCAATDPEFLRQILPSFDQETRDFFRWKVEYRREELEELITKKSGIDFGTLRDLIPISRGPSGRISKLKIVGSSKTVTVGKELEIRKWLSASHLYSSAFTVTTERDAEGLPQKFILTGAGWGHGVGFCQIGGAVMASKGFDAEAIVKHYFKGTELAKLY
ncbi:MAG TPA: SpoIID/LytB domain-containing protein [Bacteroidota bacterium]